MKITSLTKYKSLPPLDVKISNWTVLTGLNGSGKTHLLKGIEEKIISNIISDSDTENNTSIFYTSYETLNPKDNTVNSSASKGALSILQTNAALLTEFQTNTVNQPYLSMSQYYAHSDALRRVEIIESIAKKLNKTIRELNEIDIYEHFPTYNGTSIFDINLSGVFKSYSDKLDENKYKKYRHFDGEPDIIYLEQNEFEQLYGIPPWNVVNNILDELSLDYRINSPLNNKKEQPFTAILTNITSNDNVKFSDLSSGERILISLVFALYSSKKNEPIPKLLLLDEIDATLHPSMCKQLLNIVGTVFVKQLGVNVIMTTHSPSTVALAPEECLYVMNKTGNRIEKTTKDKALSILTAGVPTLSISYENRRQVFVESFVDVFVYERIYQKLRTKLIPEISIDFISSGVGGIGNCEQVKEVVNMLTKFGNKTVYGIIDWDLTNNGNQYIKVLGHSKRYSIENYVFDPLILAAFLLRDKLINKQDVGLVDDETYLDMKKFDSERLQVIADYIVNSIKPVTEQGSSTLQTAHYISGKGINIPEWYLHYQGHDLEKAIKSIYPQLKAYKSGLKKEIVEKLIDDLPELISTDILTLFQIIQNIV